jgi:hypothetical protein
MTDVDILAMAQAALGAVVGLSGGVVAFRNLLTGTGALAKRFQGWMLRGAMEELDTVRSLVDANAAHIAENSKILCEIRLLSSSSTWDMRLQAAALVESEGWNGHLQALAGLIRKEYQEYLRDDKARHSQ